MGQGVAREPESASRFETLDALRGVCALAVAFFHMPFTHPLHAAPRTGGTAAGSLDLGGPLLNLAAALGLVGVTILLAGLSYRPIERPSLAWFKELDLRTFAEPSAASAPMSQIEKLSPRQPCGDWSPLGQYFWTGAVLRRLE